MIYILILFIGIFVGLSIRKIEEKIDNFFNHGKHKDYRVTFSTSFFVHCNQLKNSSQIISSPDVEIIVREESEEDAADFVRDFIRDNMKIEIKSIEII